MIDLVTGKIIINKELTLSPQFTFDDFKKTSYFNNHDGIESIELNEQQIIDDNSYFVSFFFKDLVIYAITLMIVDKTKSERDEANRKKLHDEVLRLNNIEDGKEYSWGSIVSVYDKRSDSSEIIIVYKK